LPRRDFLARHEVATAYEKGWSTFTNGDLLDAAEREGYEVLVTTDANLRHQQHLDTRRIAVVVLMSTSWLRIQRAVTSVVGAIDGISVGAYVEVSIP